MIKIEQILFPLNIGHPYPENLYCKCCLPTKRDPDDEIKQRHDAMKLAMNDPDKLREYYEPPTY